MVGRGTVRQVWSGLAWIGRAWHSMAWKGINYDALFLSLFCFGTIDQRRHVYYTWCMTLTDMFRRFPTEEHCIAYLEKIRWPKGKPVCPYCGHECTPNKRKDGRYNCGSCHRAFRATVKTLFHKSHHPLQKWFLLIVLMLNGKKGVSESQLARDIGVPQPTVWLMCHKIRKAMQADQGELLQGIVEIDEFYSGGKPRKGNGGGNGKSKRGRGTAKVPVFGAIERGGDVRARVAQNVTKESIREFIKEYVDEGALIYSDSYRSYHGITDKQVDHNRNFVDEEGVHTNNVESFWAIVKRGIFGQFHSVKKKYLNLYLSEFCYRFNRRKVDCVFDETVAWLVATPNIGKSLV